MTINTAAVHKRDDHRKKRNASLITKGEECDVTVQWQQPSSRPHWSKATFQLPALRHDSTLWSCMYRKPKFHINIVPQRTPQHTARTDSSAPLHLEFTPKHAVVQDTSLEICSASVSFESSKSPVCLQKRVRFLWPHMKQSDVAVASHVATLGTCKESSDITNLCWSSRSHWQQHIWMCLLCTCLCNEQASRGTLSKILVTFLSQNSTRTRWTCGDCMFLH